MRPGWGLVHPARKPGTRLTDSPEFSASVGTIPDELAAARQDLGEHLRIAERTLERLQGGRLLLGVPEVPANCW